PGQASRPRPAACARDGIRRHPSRRGLEHRAVHFQARRCGVRSLGRTSDRIDSSCRSFFIKGASADYMSRSPNMWSLYSAEAIFIAQTREIPTHNAYRAWGPGGGELGNPQEDPYQGRVDKWIRRNRLYDVCELDIERRTMTPHEP